MSKIILALLTLLLSTSLFLISSTPTNAAAWSGDCVVNGDVATIRGVQCLVSNFLEPVPALIIVAALFMVIYSGAKLIQGANDPKAIATAWSTFTYALIGIVLLGVVWLILIIIEQFTGAKVTEFGIK